MELYSKIPTVLSRLVSALCLRGDPGLSGKGRAGASEARPCWHLQRQEGWSWWSQAAGVGGVSNWAAAGNTSRVGDQVHMGLLPAVLALQALCQPRHSWVTQRNMWKGGGGTWVGVGARAG